MWPLMAPLLLQRVPQATVLQDAKLDALTERLRVAQELPNLYVTVAFNGKIYGSAAGFRKDSTSAKSSLSDRFRIGSVTKPLTSVLILKLAAEGLIDLDRPFLDYFPEAARTARAEYKQATVARLLAHASGLSGPGTSAHSGRRAGEAEQAYRTRARLESVTKWVMEEPVGPVGSYTYSNNGFSILGSLAESVGRKSYSDLLREKVFAPLGMSGAGVGMPGSKDDPWYAPLKGGKLESHIEPIPANDQGPTADAQGGVFWNCESAGRFLLDQINLFHRKASILPPDFALRVFTGAAPRSASTLVWSSWQEGRFGIAFVHNGQNSDHRGTWSNTHTRIVPNHGFAVSVSTATGAGNMVELANDIQAFVLGKP